MNSQDSFKFEPVSEESIRKSLKRLSANKVTGLDDLPTRFFREGADIIAFPISHIINLSLYSGQVPDDMKLTRAVPLYKKNSKTDCSNYRPVSI